LITVILPTHNPAPPILARTLAALAGQAPEPAGQIILVDNASDPPVNATEWASALPGLTVVRETRLGLTLARAAGIAASSGELIVFVDDDNLLAPDYLGRAREFFAAHPEVGAAGGRILPEFARPPARWMKSHFGLLALRDYGAGTLISAHRAGAVESYDSFAPIGAGLAIRAGLARAYLDWARSAPRTLPGRQGTILGSSEDCEIVMCVLRASFQIAYAPGLRLTHIIPERRLRFGYLARLAYCGSVSWSQFRVRHGFARRIPLWTIGPRALRAFFAQRAWTPAGYIGWRGACGQFAGLGMR